MCFLIRYLFSSISLDSTFHTYLKLPNVMIKSTDYRQAKFPTMPWPIPMQNVIHTDYTPLMNVIDHSIIVVYPHYSIYSVVYSTASTKPISFNTMCIFSRTYHTIHCSLPTCCDCIPEPHSCVTGPQNDVDPIRRNCDNNDDTSVAIQRDTMKALVITFQSCNVFSRDVETM